MTTFDEITRQSPHVDARRQIAELQYQLSVERNARTRVEDDARKLSEFINSRVGVEVWDHRDVVSAMHASFAQFGSALHADIQSAQRSGIPATYPGVQRILVGRFDRTRADLLNWLGEPGNMSALAVPALVSERMRIDVENATRMRAAA